MECAIAIQRTMAERKTTVPPARQMRFRIGVNLGDVMYDGTRVYGDGLNVAARVQELAAPGGICVTAMVREEVGARTSLAFEDLGAQSLKNIPRPVRVFHVRLDDQERTGYHTAPSWATRYVPGVVLSSLVSWWCVHWGPSGSASGSRSSAGSRWTGPACRSPCYPSVT